MSNNRIVVLTGAGVSAESGFNWGPNGRGYYLAAQLLWNPERDPEAEKREQERASLHDVMEMATKFFEEQLQSAVGAKARAYLRERGLTVADSDANFVLFGLFDDRHAVWQGLLDRGVLIREVGAITGSRAAAAINRIWATGSRKTEWNSSRS